MVGGARVATGVAVLLAALAGCTSPLPTPSLSPTPSPSATPATSAPAVTPSPTASSITSGSPGAFPSVFGLPSAPYPTSVLGLPVLTVDGASRLLLDGKLDGRVVAVSGYWMVGLAMPCPWAPRPTLTTACLTVGFADEYLRLGTYTENSYTWHPGRQRVGLLIPLTVSETSQGRSGFVPAQMTADNPNPAQRVVVIGHAGDARLWQCAPDQRDECGDVFVVDRFAWVNGIDQGLVVPYTELEASLTVDAVLAAGHIDPTLALTAYPVRSSELGSIDPRLVGVGGDVVWAVRAVSGSADAAGTAPARNVVVDDADGSILRTVPLEVADDYAPARLTVNVFDERTPSGGAWGYASFTVAHVAGLEIRSQTPFSLAPGSYTLRGQIVGDLTSPPPGPPCQTDVDLVANQDLWMTVSFAVDGSCEWAVSEPLP